MLATPGSLPPAAQDARWAYETKQDGQRAVIYLEGDGSLLLRARSGEDITAAYPELRPLGGALGTTPAVLDGEIMALDEEGRADFQLLQSRMGLAHAPARAARMAAQTPSTWCSSTYCTWRAAPCSRSLFPAARATGGPRPERAVLVDAGRPGGTRLRSSGGHP